MADSYRPMRRDRDPPAPKSLADRMTFTNGGDNYRPGGGQNHSEFTFESNHPAPRFPPSGPANGNSRPPARSNRGRGRGRAGHHGPSHHDRNNANGYQRGGRYKKAAPHERALLQHRDDTTEHTYGVSDGPNRFMNIDDMSDHEEADMEVESDASGAGDDAEGQTSNHKVAKTETPRADGNTVPKWSNPDPYTSLPPPSETTGVKRDVVQLIRKAKNQAAEKAIGNNAVAANDDFISFGDDDGTDVGADDKVDEVDDDDSGLRMYEDDEPVPVRSKHTLPPRPVEGSLNEAAYASNMYSEPPRDRYQPSQARRGNKRKVDASVTIVDEWVASSRDNPTPWADDPETYKHLAKDPEKWLHNEILDFYDFVAPQPFEHDARHKLVQRISQAFGSQRWFPNEVGRILCFGSYPAGLYLPTADMDLVYASERHYNGGPPVLESSTDKSAFKKTLFKASRRLQTVGIASNPLVIAGARVPIIKFEDRMTGIAVDISFENLSGVQAQATFDQWKREHPDMIYMVALVKQLLVMRGLNEVHTGGLGGFSIICLIVSYIQHSRKAENLGECFVGFLEYYGKNFDISRKRIQMNPPGVIEKTAYGIDGRQEQSSGLSIQDPNKLDNNISGGSRRAVDAFKVFSAAYDTLTDRMRASKSGASVGPSLLGSIIGGNYMSYIKQRRHLQTLNAHRLRHHHIGAQLTKKHDFDEIDRNVEHARMSGDEWEQELRWMYKVQHPAYTRTVLYR